MSRMTDRFREIKVVNNWELLTRYGSGNDVAIEYSRPAEGRAGWCETTKTTVWSPWQNPKLEKPRKFQPGTNREFGGLRRESLPLALAWAKEQFGADYVSSPFGGYIPKGVWKRALLALQDAA